MNKKEINVHLDTITPLFTGDAWQKTTKIRPSSLMGSLRFWFEVICYFSGVVSEENFDKAKERFEKEVNEKKFKDKHKGKGTDIRSQIETLIEMNIPLPSIIFGTTGWRGLIEIKEIEPLYDYRFVNKLNLPGRICVSKLNGDVKENNNCPNGSNNTWSVFYFSNTYFYGEFKVKFLVEEEILNSIFYPLLNFMDEYGYCGGKWNIGYGRLKVVEVKQNNNGENWKIEKFDFSIFNAGNSEKFGLEKYLKSVDNFDDLIQVQRNNKKNKDFK